MEAWKRISRGILAMALCVFCISGCKGRAQPEDKMQLGDKAQPEDRVQTESLGGKLKVVATLFPYYDFARQIAGDKVELVMVVPAGMDSHSFEPTPADVRTIQEADVLICNGGAMEHWLGQTLEALDTSHMTVVAMMDYVDVVEEELVEGMEENVHPGHGKENARPVRARENAHPGHERENAHLGYGEENAYTGHEEPEEDDGYGMEIEYDEHIWTSPVNAMKFTQVIAGVLAEADPENRQAYQAGQEAYLEELERVHQGFLQVAGQKKRNMIVVGDKFPFRYLAEEYGFHYRAAFSGCSTDTEPSARTIAYLIDKVKGEGIPAVYYLEFSSRRVSEIIGEETGARPMLLHSCHNVTRREFEDGVTYVDLMLQNVENLRKGLDE